jgi:DNA-3-methyladenine glycosylase I
MYNLSMQPKRPSPAPEPTAHSHTLTRCSWAKGDLYIAYHDKEWGVPVHDDRLLFEFLVLEGAQAGLSWLTILKKRPNYRQAFCGFDPAKVSRFDGRKVQKLLADEGIVRNHRKIESAVTNAKAFLAVQKEFGSFDQYLWQFVGRQPICNRRRSLAEIPARTPESDALSKDLLKRGFKFVGSTICYAFMQAVGMVNDHTIDCFRFDQRPPSARNSPPPEKHEDYNSTSAGSPGLL